MDKVADLNKSLTDWFFLNFQDCQMVDLLRVLLVYVFQVTSLTVGQSSTLEVNKNLISLVNKSISQTSVTFRRLSYLQHEINSEISKNVQPNLVNKSAEQFLKMAVNDAVKIEEIEKSQENMAALDELLVSLSLKNIHRLLIESKEDSESLAKIRERIQKTRTLFGSDSFIETVTLMHYLRYRSSPSGVKKFGSMASKNLEELLEPFSSANLKNNLLLKEFSNKLWCLPFFISDISPTVYESLVKNQEELISFRYPKKSEKDLEVATYRMYYNFKVNKTEQVCSIFDNIPGEWLTISRPEVSEWVYYIYRILVELNLKNSDLKNAEIYQEKLFSYLYKNSPNSLFYDGFNPCLVEAERLRQMFVDKKELAKIQDLENKCKKIGMKPLPK